MHLERIGLTNFKNYELNELEFSDRINCFVGNNGVGKTNILDAIHYLSLTKSFFNNVDGINIRHGEEYFIIRGSFLRKEEEESIHIAFQRQKQKTVRRNGKEYQRISDHVGRYPVVMISPADSVLITEGSEERRRFMNKIVSQYNSEYLESVLKYGKALQQRNRLLKDQGSSGSADRDMIAMWDAQLVKYGTYIYSERKALVDELIPVFSHYYELISSGRETVRLQYSSHLGGSDFASLLDASYEKDRLLEYTTTGVHKDDLILEMDGHQVKILGSQGQQKSYLVALKLAKYDYIRQKSGLNPILLLDDIFDKFDAGRVEEIIKLVGDKRFGQIFITDTHQDRLQRILSSHNTEYRLFRIEPDGTGEIIHNGNSIK
jgi:DNA replication and repair protein RecF